MADVANVSGVRSGTQAFTQAYLSRSVRSTLNSILPLVFLILAMDGTKQGMNDIGVPGVGALISNVESAKVRKREIFGSEMYQPLIHSTDADIGDGRTLGMRDTMPILGGAGGAGAVITAVTGANPYVTGFAVLNGGTGYSGSTAATVVGGTTGSAATVTLTISGGVITAAAVNSSGNGYTAVPYLTVQGTGTSHDQHYKRPGVKWVDHADPILVYKKPQSRLKNLTKGASSGDKEAILASLLQKASNEVKAKHMQFWGREFWGIATTSDTGPTSQSAEVWDHMPSLPSACHATNTYAMVDRSVTGNEFWKGKRQTSHRAANLEDLFNEANYTGVSGLVGCADIDLPIKVLLCGPTLFPAFMNQALARGGQTIYPNKRPGIGEFGVEKPIIKFMDMYVVYDPMCPDKARTDPRTGSAYTKNACLGANLDTWTFAIDPDRNFTVDPFFDLTQIEGGKDALKSQVRTEMLGVCEAPAGNFYWEDVG